MFPFFKGVLLLKLWHSCIPNILSQTPSRSAKYRNWIVTSRSWFWNHLWRLSVWLLANLRRIRTLRTKRSIPASVRSWSAKLTTFSMHYKLGFQNWGDVREECKAICMGILSHTNLESKRAVNKYAWCLTWGWGGFFSLVNLNLRFVILGHVCIAMWKRSDTMLA